MRWYRRLVARKYDGSSKRRAGRPRVGDAIERLVLKFAGENPRWGYTRIRGALSSIGHQVARSTIARILKDNGIDPSPKRATTWNTFLKSHWGAIAATDFFSVEVLTRAGLVRYFVLFVIDLETRRVQIANIPLGEAHLRLVVREFVEHYNAERHHQGLDNHLIESAPHPENDNGSIHNRSRLGGLLNFSHRGVA